MTIHSRAVVALTALLAFAPGVAGSQALPAGELLGVNVPLNLTAIDPTVKSVRVTCWLDSGTDPVTGQTMNLGAAPQGAFSDVSVSPDAARAVKEVVHVGFLASAFAPGTTPAALNTVMGGRCRIGFDFATQSSCLSLSSSQTTGACGHAAGTQFLTETTFKFAPAAARRRTQPLQ